LHRYWRGSLVFLGVVGAFVAGVTASDFVKAVRQIMYEGEEVKCIEKNVCVGDKSPSAFVRLDTDKFGLTNLICVNAHNTTDYNAIEYIFLDDIIAGKRCKGREYLVELRNPTFRTLVEVRDGRITKITKGPLHVIDL
jgi:hypothetical protein